MTTVRPEDLEAAADVAVSALEPAIGKDWSVRARGLEWSVEFTVAHMAAGTAKAALYLASRSTRFIAVTMGRWPGASQAEQLAAISGAAKALANVARMSPEGARGFHTSGMLDAEGHLTKGCIEMFAHAYDVTGAWGLPFTPPDELCQRLVARAFPWVSDGGPAWEAFLSQTGRLDAPGFPSDDTWVAALIPRAEWDGEIPKRDPRPIVEWVLDQGAWEPRYWDKDQDMQ